MAAMRVDQSLADHQPEPEEERRGAGAVEMLEPPRGLEKGFLEDIVGIDPAEQAVVEPDPYHPPEAVAVLGERGRELSCATPSPHGSKAGLSSPWDSAIAGLPHFTRRHHTRNGARPTAVPPGPAPRTR